MTNRMEHAIQRLTTVTAAQLNGLAALLADCVEGGASVSFMLPLLSIEPCLGLEDHR